MRDVKCERCEIDSERWRESESEPRERIGFSFNFIVMFYLCE